MIDVCLAIIIVSLLATLTLSFSKTIENANTKMNDFEELQEEEYERLIKS